ncbi:carbamoyl-phosphate synthase large subunit [Rothia mucilaginosa DY-18]|uniref:Carbamoyl-phosphate synthase large subunit n=1 Tax=Rothia mucilaginosa (strain DY-18) TaxID=680646 RepID=D2NPF4_ROTMD|nr:carbamoyl-phosphate synthase large subunit [Rothia mucilaginosa DY-18]
MCTRLALLRQVVQQRGGQLRVMRQRRAVQVSHRRNQTHRRRQPHAVRLEQILRVERTEAQLPTGLACRLEHRALRGAGKDAVARLGRVQHLLAVLNLRNQHRRSGALKHATLIGNEDSVIRAALLNVPQDRHVHRVGEGLRTRQKPRVGAIIHRLVAARQQHRLHTLGAALHDGGGHRRRHNQRVRARLHGSHRLGGAARNNDLHDVLFTQRSLGTGGRLTHEALHRRTQNLGFRVGQIQHARRRLEAGQVHAELTHTAVDGQHGLEDAVAAGEALIINADEGHGRVNEDALRVLLVQKNYGTRHSLIVRSHPEPARDNGTRPRSYRGRWTRHAEGRCYPRSYRGTRPRFASDTLMSLTDNTAPPGHTHRYVLMNG